MADQTPKTDSVGNTVSASVGGSVSGSAMKNVMVQGGFESNSKPDQHSPITESDIITALTEAEKLSGTKLNFPR